MIRIDMHVHSDASFDGKDDFETIMRAAAFQNLDFVAITDHCDLVPQENGYAMYEQNQARIALQIQLCEQMNRKACQLIHGIEIGNPMYDRKRADQFVSERELDFVIGAIHYFDFDTDYLYLDYENPQVREFYLKEYFSRMLELAQWGNFDSLAHLDYPLRAMDGLVACPPSFAEYRDEIIPILETIANKGIALEINTRGTYDWQKRTGPELWVLKEFHRLGGKHITIGSDAHTAERVGCGVEDGVAAAKAAGFDHITIYRNREPVDLPI